MIWTDDRFQRPYRRLLEDLPIVALLAVNDLGSLGCVGRLHFCMALIAAAVVELPGISQLHPIEVALIRMSSRDRKGVLAVEVKLLLDDAEGFLGDLALYGPVEDIIRDVLDILREFVCRDDLLDFGERRFVVGPVEAAFEPGL